MALAGFAGFAHDRPIRSGIAVPCSRRRARGRRRGAPASRQPRSAPRPRRPVRVDVVRRRRDTWPTMSRWSEGLRTGSDRRLAALASRGTAATSVALRRASREQRQLILIGQIEARRVSREPPYRSRGSAIFWCGEPRGSMARATATGSAIRSSMGTSRISDAVDERGISAVLQQTPHQIGQQCLMRANGRVDSAGPVKLLRANDFLIKRLAHAVQALELVLASVIVSRPWRRWPRANGRCGWRTAEKPPRGPPAACGRRQDRKRRYAPCA